MVEDQPAIRKMIRIALERDGYFVLAGCDGKEALGISRQYPGTIHALVTDLEMPGMNGLKLREIVLNERPGIKVMLMSGLIEGPEVDVPILWKPFKLADLRKHLRQLLS